jgi:hypothetical protein
MRGNLQVQKTYENGYRAAYTILLQRLKQMNSAMNMRMNCAKRATYITKGWEDGKSLIRTSLPEKENLELSI